MDVLNEQIIDIGLNVIGYLVAGGLGVLTYSMFQGRRRPSEEPIASASTPAPVAETPTRPTDRQDIQFVNLRPAPRDKAAETVKRDATPAKPATAHRDRREIIRLARQMLQAGAAGEQIKRTLPISQSELALLQNGNTK